MNSLRRYINLLHQNPNSGLQIWVLTSAGILQGLLYPRFSKSAHPEKEEKGLLAKGVFSDDMNDQSNAEAFTLIYVTLIPVGKTFARGETVSLSSTVVSYDAVLAWGDDYSFYWPGEEPKDSDDDEDD